jgi:predicted O-methyltransferase YrrM
MSKKRRHHPRALPVRVVADARGQRALEVAGVVQSLEVDAHEPLAPAESEPRPAPRGGYWGLMLPPGCPGRALLLGLGGGTVAWLLARRCPEIELVGVERDEEVLAVARTEFGLDELNHLQVVTADALRWVEEQAIEEAGGYDLMCMDLFEGGRLAQGALATPYLRALAGMLTADGVLTANLLITARTPEQLHRLRRIFRIERELRHHGNLIVHARPLSKDAPPGE